MSRLPSMSRNGTADLKLSPTLLRSVKPPGKVEHNITNARKNCKLVLDIADQLQPLTRQSGGVNAPGFFIHVSTQERSLTAILYLKSLTEEARTPFSLVDDIDQGMDQDAERLVHNSMDVQARKLAAFPHLLPDLDYRERVKILCVDNGEWRILGI